MTADNGDYPHAATNPFNNPAIAVELTMRERQALMTADDWALNVDRLLALPGDLSLSEGMPKNGDSEADS